MPKTLLISGCSYGMVYSEIEKELKDLFGVDEVVNLSQFGASPDRQIRVAIEWIAQNGKPDMVIMPVSHYNRFDLPIANKFDPLHNLHHKSNWHRIADHDKIDTDIVSLETLETYMKSGAIVHTVEHTEHDKLFVKLITFQAYLELNKIKHLIFDTGNYYEKLWMQYLSIDDENNSGYQPGMKKRDLIENSTGIYRLLSFCSNVWMYEQLTEDEKKNYIPWDEADTLRYPLDDHGKATIHHQKEQVLKLIKHLKQEGAVHD
jgi:hypothetical protein